MRARGTHQSLVLWMLAVCVTPVLAQPALTQSEGMPWRTDFQSARAEAQQKGKLLLVHFWTETCGPCKLLDKRVFEQPQVAVAVCNEYIPVKVNANESPEIAQAYGVTRVPTDVVVTAQGQLVHSFVSPSTPMEYVAATSQVANVYRTQAGSAFAAAVAAAPAPSTTVGHNNPAVPAAPASQTVAGVPMSPTATGPSANGPSQQTAMAASNPYAAPPAATPAPATPAADRYAVAASQPQQQMTPAVASAAPQAHPQQQASVQQQAPVQQPAPVQQQAQPPVVADVAPQLPSGSPALGFEGFCPVTMKNEWRWAKGDVRWGAIHNGRTYLFASEAAQKTFLANPDAYSPVLAGSDPVAAVDQQKSVPGVREFAVEFEGRFYLFASEKSLEKFWSNPAAYAQGAQRVAALPAGDSFIR